MIEWLGQASCADSNVFPGSYMQDAAPDPLPGMSQPIKPVAPSTVQPSKNGNSWWWIAPVAIGGVAGLLFWRTIA